MNYLLDTNIISEVRKGTRCDLHVARWFENISDDSVYLSVLVLGEIRKGIESKRLRDKAQAVALEKWLANVSEAFGERILTVNEAIADEWGRMSAIRSLSVIDGLLAATARVHRMTLVTRNISDVTGLGALVLNPFEQARR